MKAKGIKAVLLFLLLFAIVPFGRFEPRQDPLNALIILPGTTKKVDIKQTDLFPLGCSIFIIGVLGKGTLGISAKKDDVAEDVIFMLAAAVSTVGAASVFRIGISTRMIDRIVEIGSYEKLYGFV